MTPQERFWAKVDKTDTCWLWTGSRTNLGYGQFRLGGACRFAHRVAFVWAKGDVPDGLVLDHLCRTPNCVNPDHLEPVTQRVNVLRGESPAARQARLTECSQGHRFDAGNTHIDSKGKRRCRQCKAAANRARYLPDGLCFEAWESDLRAPERGAK